MNDKRVRRNGIKPWIFVAAVVGGALLLIGFLNARTQAQLRALDVPRAPLIAAATPAPREAASSPRSEQPFVRRQIPRTPDPVVIDMAVRVIFDEREQLRTFDDDDLEAKLHLMTSFGALVDAGHGPGVLTLIRDLCFPTTPIASQEDFEACVVADVLTSVLTDRQDPVAAADAVYRAITAAIYLQRTGQLADPPEYLARIERKIVRARRLNADPREMDMLSDRVAALKTQIANQRSAGGDLLIAFAAALLASDNPSPATRQHQAREADKEREREEQRRRDECFARGVSGDAGGYRQYGC